MPYVLLVIGAALGLYGLYKFFITANPRQITAFLLAAVLMALTVALFFMAVTGRLPAAIALAVAIWPVALAWWKARQPRIKPKDAQDSPPPATHAPLSRSEAFKILGLESTAGADEVEDAYKRLMLKVHPDQDGSDWIAAKLNEARDTLLK